MIALFVVVGIINGVLNAVPIIGTLVGLCVSFYALIIAGWLRGNGFAEATEGKAASAPGTVGPAQ